MLCATDLRILVYRSSVFLVLFAGVAGNAIHSANAQTIWATSISLELQPDVEIAATVQRIDTAENRQDIVIENRLGGKGENVDFISWSFSLYGESIYSVNSGARARVDRWDANSGAELAPVELEDSFSDHTLGSHSAAQLDHADNGDLLISSHGHGRESRTLARYSPTGKHLVDYAHPNLMHQHGSAVATDNSVFVISRYNNSGSWVEKVLAFADDGGFLGELDVPVGSPTDLAVWNNELVVIGAASDPDNPELGGLNVYQLDGQGGLPQYSETVSFPEGVAPKASHLGSLAYEEGLFYVATNSDVHQIDRTGQLLNTFTVATLGENPDYVQELIVTSGAIQVPEPAGASFLIAALAVVVASCRRQLWPRHTVTGYGEVVAH